jgi:hypothetical protein
MMRRLMDTSAPAAEEPPEQRIGRRSHGRLRLYLPAQMVTIHGRQHVQLQNLSRGGLKVCWSDPVRVGSWVVIVWTHYELFGSVIWSQNLCGGVELEVPLPETMVLAMRAHETSAAPKPNEVSTAWYLENLRYHKTRR